MLTCVSSTMDTLLSLAAIALSYIGSPKADDLEKFVYGFEQKEGE